MKTLWTWSGTFFGHRDRIDLWTFDGRHVGRFYDDEVYGPDARYLGEILRKNRLITCLKKKSRHKEVFDPYDKGVGVIPYADDLGLKMIAGYEDFPSPENLR